MNVDLYWSGSSTIEAVCAERLDGQGASPPPSRPFHRLTPEIRHSDGRGARRRTVLRDSTGALRPEAERMAGGGGCYLPAGQCTAGVTIPPISGQGGAEASLEIDPTTDRAADCAIQA